MSSSVSTGIKPGLCGALGMDVDFGRYGNFDDFINDLLGRFGGAGAGGFQSSGFPEAVSRVGSQEGAEPPGLPSIWMQKPRSMSASLKRFEAANEPCPSITRGFRCAFQLG